MTQGIRYDERDLSAIMSSGHFRADDGVFFAGELAYIKSRTYDIQYPELTATRLIPVSNEAGAGAESIYYHQYDEVGIARIISNYSTDLPRADILGKEFSARVKSIGTSYGYSIQDIRAARMKGLPLEQRKANAARRANDQAVNSIAYFGDVEHDIYGLFNHPNITSYILPADGTLNGVTAGTPASMRFVNKTPDQVLRDLNGMMNNMIKITKGVEIPNTLVLSYEVHGDLATRPRGSVNDTTILEFFEMTAQNITNIEVIPEAGGAGINGTDIVMMYNRSPDKLTLEIPQPFEQFPVQSRGLEYIVPCHSRVGGVIIYYPLSISMAEGA